MAFPNRDTYFGGYAADAKAGLGLYVFANGGAYIGQYKGGKRHGQGLMILPDGGLYRGGFVADKFEGQVGDCSMAGTCGPCSLAALPQPLLCCKCARTQSRSTLAVAPLYTGAAPGWRPRLMSLALPQYCHSIGCHPAA